MTNKIYRSAQGKSVDLGTIMLQNEHVRAVGNMKVNARGDKIDGLNQVIETRVERVQKQTDKATTNVSNTPLRARARKTQQPVADNLPVEQTLEEEPESLTEEVAPDDVVVVASPEPEPSLEPVPGGLAEAIARSREIKQNLEKTRRQQAQEKGLRKI